MDFRPVELQQSSEVNDTLEDVSCGFVLHRISKSYKIKQRWGVLRIEKTSNSGKCVMKLYKQHANQNHPNNGKLPRLKHELEFTKKEFCGVEKGEIYGRYGMRRYMCIVTENEYIVLEDAVVTVSGINHNVLGTWHQMVTQAMGYVNKWKIKNDENKYLHVSEAKLSECYSLENKSKTNLKSLALRSWEVSTIKEIREKVEQHGTTTITTVNFVVQLPTGSESVNLIIQGFPNLRSKIVSNLPNQNQPSSSSTYRGFDDLNYKPNLVKTTARELKNDKLNCGNPHAVGEKEKSPANCDFVSPGNLYVDLGTLSLKANDGRQKETNLVGNEEVKLPIPAIESSSSSDEDEGDGDKSFKGPGLATQTCYDSDYQTGESFSTIYSQQDTSTATSNNTSYPPYINLQPPSIPPKIQTRTSNSAHCSSAPPPVPQRNTKSCGSDLLSQSVENGSLPPAQDEVSYENNLSFELSIDEVLQMRREGGAERWFNIPYSIMVQIFIELEKDGITIPDWKSLAERLGLTFRDIQQLVALMRVKNQIRPMEVILFHWRRLETPLPFTKENFKKLLAKIGRDDLAKLV